MVGNGIKSLLDAAASVLDLTPLAIKCQSVRVTPKPDADDPNAMSKIPFVWMVFLLALMTFPALAEENLSQWAASFSAPETQHAVLQAIYPDDLGPASSASLDSSRGTYLFSKGDRWVQLAKDNVWRPSAGGGDQPILIVTALLRRGRDQAPSSAISYVFRDTGPSPFPISGGYAGRERLSLATLPQLGQSFVIVKSLFTDSQGSVTSEAAVIYRMNPHESGNPLRVVWTSKPSVPYFQLGFATIHDSGGEDLLLKSAPPLKDSASNDSGAFSAPTEESDQRFAAYRWNGEQFETDDSVFDSQFNALSSTIWQY